MKAYHIISITTVVLLVALTTSASALEPNFASPRAAYNLNVIPGPGDHSGIPQGANTCPADNVGVLTSGDTIVGSTIGSTDDFVAPCGSNAGGQDEIFEFAVDLPGEWSFDSCTVPACWDTTLSIHEETGGGCPGDIVACDGDGCPVCYYDSLVQTFLVPTSTYYLIVDGWSSFAYGDFTISVFLAVPGCLDDTDCDDGIFCNGSETCNAATGQCSGGSNPCSTYEGYSAPCDNDLGACVKPDNCFTWMTDSIGSGYFFPQANNCASTATWVFDDVQYSHHTSGILNYYTTPIIARSTPAGASPLGTVFLVNQALFTTTSGSCVPEAEIAGSQCTGAATVDTGGSPAHDLPCSGTTPALPNNAGDFTRCEIDFWMAYRTSQNGAGMGIAGNKPELGGPAGADDFGVSVIALEDCPPTGDYSTVTFFGDDANLPADFTAATVCMDPIEIHCPDDPIVDGVECDDPAETCGCPNGPCNGRHERCLSLQRADCVCTFVNCCSALPNRSSGKGCDGPGFGEGTINFDPGTCEGDPDGDNRYNRCGDNCPDDFNPFQEDCDDDGIGDACDTETDGDEDCVCDGPDNCPFTPNPGQEDKDGDGLGDACDPCPNANPDDADNDGVCDDVDTCLGHDDNQDADGDGVPDGCDQCPNSDDGAAGALDDDDGDGVINCNDQCSGVDDALFAPECDSRIPTVSVWGLVVLALLLLAAGKIYFSRRGSPA